MTQDLKDVGFGMNAVTTSQITVEPVDHSGGDARIALSAMVSTYERVSHAELSPAKIKGLINYLVEHRHGTPFEHGSMTFLVSAPIFVWREHHRHRIGFSYNEESGRYKQLQPKFWIPRPDRPMVPIPKPEFCANKTAHSTTLVSLIPEAQGIAECPACKTQYRYHTSARPCLGPVIPEKHEFLVENLKIAYEVAYKSYLTGLENGIAKEVARACLPVAIYSSCYVTCNPRSLMHFLSLRVRDDAATFPSYPQAEIQEVAQQYEALFQKWWPITHEAFVAHGRVAP